MPDPQEKPGSSGSVVKDAFSGLTPEVLQSLLMNAFQGAVPFGVDVKVDEERPLAQMAGALLTPGPEDVLKIAGLPFFSRFLQGAKTGAKGTGKAIDAVADQFDPMTGISANLIRSARSNRPAQIQKEVDDILAQAKRLEAEELLQKKRPVKGGIPGFKSKANLTFEPEPEDVGRFTEVGEAVTNTGAFGSVGGISNSFKVVDASQNNIGRLSIKTSPTGTYSSYWINGSKPEEIIQRLDETFDTAFDQALKMSDGTLQEFTASSNQFLGDFYERAGQKSVQKTEKLADDWILKAEVRHPDWIFFRDKHNIVATPRTKIEPDVFFPENVDYANAIKKFLTGGEG